MDGLELLLIAGVGLVAGAINTVAGGGSLLTLPMLIFLGLPAGVANGTNRVGVVLQSATATIQFRREKLLNTALIARLIIPTSLGAILGAWLSLDIEEAQFRTIIGIAMVLMLPFILLKPHKTQEEDEDALPKPQAPVWLQIIIFFGIGVYGGFLQAGVGVFLLTGLVRGCGQDLVRSNGIKVALVLAFATLSMAIFAWQGMIDWGCAVALAVGSVGGGWIGAKMTVSWGPSFIRGVLVVTVLTSASKLMGLW